MPQLNTGRDETTNCTKPYEEKQKGRTKIARERCHSPTATPGHDETPTYTTNVPAQCDGKMPQPTTARKMRDETPTYPQTALDAHGLDKAGGIRKIKTYTH